jgi:hypothetical protein
VRDLGCDVELREGLDLDGVNVGQVFRELFVVCAIGHPRGLPEDSRTSPGHRLLADHGVGAKPREGVPDDA